MGKIKFFLVCSVLIFLVLGCGKKTLPDEQGAAGFLIIYDKVVEACRSGDVAAFKELRDSDEVDKLEQIQSYQGKTITPELLKSFAGYFPDHKSYQQIGVVKSGIWARIDFQRDSPEVDATGKPRIEFLLILFKNEEEGWKFSRVATVGQLKFSEDGSLSTLDGADIPALVRVPPQEP